MWKLPQCMHAIDSFHSSHADRRHRAYPTRYYDYQAWVSVQVTIPTTLEYFRTAYPEAGLLHACQPDYGVHHMIMLPLAVQPVSSIAEPQGAAPAMSVTVSSASSITIGDVTTHAQSASETFRMSDLGMTFARPLTSVEQLHLELSTAPFIGPFAAPTPKYPSTRP